MNDEFTKPPAEPTRNPTNPAINHPGKIATPQIIEKKSVESPQTSQQETIISQIELKKRQARNLIITSVCLFILSIIIIALMIILSNSDQADSQNSGPANQTTNERLLSDSNKLGLAAINFSMSNPGVFEITPENVTKIRISHLSGEFNDPRTNQPYILTTSIPEEGELQYIVGGVCNLDDSISQSGDKNNFAIRALLDNGTLSCVERTEIKQINL